MKYWRNTTPLWFEYPGFSPHLLCCGLRQETLPLCAGDVEIGATHSCVTADAHAGPGKAGVLTETALLNATEHDKGELFFCGCITEAVTLSYGVKTGRMKCFKAFLLTSKMSKQTHSGTARCQKVWHRQLLPRLSLNWYFNCFTRSWFFFSLQLTFTAVITST